MRDTRRKRCSAGGGKISLEKVSTERRGKTGTGCVSFFGAQNLSVRLEREEGASTGSRKCRREQLKKRLETASAPKSKAVETEGKSP